MKRVIKYLRLKLAFGAFVSLSSASLAADLGGYCCSFLEERVAELEATTARKGNRKVFLAIAGYVGQELTWWDAVRGSVRPSALACA
ncbi:hypothetical protein SAMN04488557_3776 [Hyphomicrobium facile]|uniref:Uncharacterized protein n=1 Tax=Hyphomicrobium facile TaxID=51670 RepID=A0A1I7NVF5_9HYPH|nr:hypothetical protein SAMN04488557_3776 [Hyphomicrobium facile]